MPRRREVPKREILPDPKFHDLQIAKFINMIMRNGKKSTAERIMYFALDNISQKSSLDSIELMEKALENVRPTVEVKSGVQFQAPFPSIRSNPGCFSGHASYSKSSYHPYSKSPISATCSKPA